jgi:hypothetical protein
MTHLQTNPAQSAAEKKGIAWNKKLKCCALSACDALAQVEKEVLKCLEMMKEVEVEVSRKKGASRKVKDLKEAIAAASNDQADLEAQQQHFKRQMATLSDRIKRLESQVGEDTWAC